MYSGFFLVYKLKKSFFLLQAPKLFLINRYLSYCVNKQLLILRLKTLTKRQVKYIFHHATDLVFKSKISHKF